MMDVPLSKAAWPWQSCIARRVHVHINLNHPVLIVDMD